MKNLFVMALALFSSVAFGAANLAKPTTSKSTVAKPATVKSVRPTTGQTSVKRDTVAPARLNRPRIVPTIGLASFDIVNMDEAETDQGLFIGVNGQIDRGPIALVAGVGYLQAGAKSSDEDVNVDYLFDYLTVHGGVKAFVENRRALYLTGGLTPMLNLHSTYDARVTGGRRVQGKVHNVRDMDILAKAGVGFEAPVSPDGKRVGAELSFNRGLFDIRTGQGVNYNQGFLFSGFLSL